MTVTIGRRELLVALGGAAAAWPRAARAQQGERMRHVAFLHPYTENDPEVLGRVVAFRQGLEALGWTENRNIRIEHRYSGGDLGQIQAYATELVRSAPDLIVSSGTPITTGDRHHPDCFQRRQRSGWTGLRGDPVASRQQYHRLHLH